MCGILGICFDGRDRTDAEWMDIAWEFSNLWIHSMRRGTDAAGVYIVNRDADIQYIKAPVTAEYLVGRDEANDDMYGYWEFVRNQLGPNTVGIIGHTRAATTGDPKYNDNNHPVVDAPIIGVHNGVITNHMALHAKYPKVAEVDSAAIMSLLKSKSANRPITKKIIANSVHELDGPFAIAIADMRKPDGIYLSRNRNPVHFHRNRTDGLLMFASTSEILEDALGDDIKTFPMPKDTVCRLSANTVKTSMDFTKLKSRKPSTKSKPTVRDLYPSTESKPLRHFNGKYYTEDTRLHSKHCKCPYCRNTGEWDVDGGDRCTKCNQLFLVVYMGGIEQRCCSCNPYGGFPE